MKAITLIPGTTQISCEERSEPAIQQPDQVKLKVLEVGICGTDREEVSGGRALAPPGEKELIIGHEMLGQVIEVGSKVSSFKAGDLAVITVRRGCDKCISCLQDQPDLCYSGEYTERGIKGRHGFQSEYVVDQEKFLVKVPPAVRPYGVLCEPMSVVQKAVEEILKLQKTRLPDWSKPEELQKKQALVAGLGPIGLLACIALRLRGLKVYGLGRGPATSDRAKIVQEIGGTYIDGTQLQYSDIPTRYGSIDLIIEAAGVAELSFHLLEALGTNGGYALTGVPGPTKPLSIAADHLIQNLVLKNQLILGSVNAGKKHWQLAIEALEKAQAQWGGVMQKLITSRYPHEQFKEALSTHSKTDIKCVLTWNQGGKS